MLLISFVLSVGLTAIFAHPLFSFPRISEEKPRVLSQQEPSTTQGDQDYSPSVPQTSMEENHQMYPMPQQIMMPPPMMPPPMMPPPMMPPSMMTSPMMQGFQSPFQQLSMLLMASYARVMALTQLMNMQNRYQLNQPNQYNDSALNNYSPMPDPLSYAQQPQVDLQNNLQNEMLQQQQAESQQQGESQNRDILEKRKIQRGFDMEIQRRERLMKRKEEENDLEKQQEEVEKILRDEEEMKRQQEETRKQILKEEQKEMEEKKKDLELRQKEELRFQKIEEEKMKKNQEKIKSNQEKMKPNQEKMKPNQEKMRPKRRAIRQQRKQNTSYKDFENVINDRILIHKNNVEKIKLN